MAIYFNEKTNGFQIGGPLDCCEKCSAISKRNDYGKLNGVEVFKMYHNGTSFCFCKEHLQEMLAPYILIDTTDFSEELEDIKVEEENITKEETKEVKTKTKKDKKSDKNE